MTTIASIDELDRFLSSTAMPEHGLNLHGLDGLCAALALAPGSVPSEQWLAWVWDSGEGTQQPEFADAEQQQRLTRQILTHYERVKDAIKAQRFAPHPTPADGDAIQNAQRWCQGFVTGMSLSPDPWDKLLDRHSEMLSPMLLLGTERGCKTISQSGTRFEEVAAALPAAVAALHAHFAAQTSPVRKAEGKVGRNEACPCGSGKKYKKCCGA